MFGEEAYSAATILIDNADKVRQDTEAVTDTNIAMEQAAINFLPNMARMRWRNGMTGKLNNSASLLYR